MLRISRLMVPSIGRRISLKPASRRLCSSQPRKLTDAYKATVISGSLSFDEKQYKLIKLLEKVQQLVEKDKSNQVDSPPIIHELSEVAETGEQPSSSSATYQRLRGVYMYGEVGTGKTMIMDMFFKSIDIPHKRRVHFSEFMLEVHRRVHLHKQQLLKQFGRDIHLNLSSERDSITIVAQDIAKEASVLCFDEFQVTDICDAMILARLFNELWKQNVLLVATSNRPPTDLYLNGLNRQYFMPFIGQLQVNCIVRNIGIDKDYRQGGEPAHHAYFVNNTAENTKALHELYVADLLQRGEKSEEVTIPVMNNRSLTLSQANLQAGVCFVEFSALCETDKGASDYQALCSHFHTVYMPNIPILSVLMHNEARRLITLIDAMYNRNVRFVWCADAEPAQLFEILTQEEVHQSNAGAALGTDHSWSGGGTLMEDHSSSRHSTSAPIEEEPQRNLRGAEQARRPLDSNMYFGATLKLAKSSSPTTATATTTDTDTDISPTTGPADAAQDELKVLEGELASVQELSFAFRRAASRLAEMSSVGYLGQRWQQGGQQAIG